MAAAAEEEGAGSGRRVAAKYNRFMSVENPRHFVYEDEIYIKYIIFVYKYALILTLTLTLTLNPNLSVKYSRHFVYEYDIYVFFCSYFVYEYEIYTKKLLFRV